MSYFLSPRAAWVFKIVFVLLISSTLFVVNYLHQQSQKALITISAKQLSPDEGKSIQDNNEAVRLQLKNNAESVKHHPRS